ncbi:MAG TPA: ATP-grasp domain-containing protein [Cyclobacteriaceae bacterium]|nr:ATP-grasp domain-containing protein [Cyclobacteriaceae bacterium]
MKKILVTGVRAPAALEIIRRLADAGYEVYAADCLHFPPGRFSAPIKEYAQLPSPRYDLKKFKSKLIGFVKKHQIDIIFPICEEVFYLSSCKQELEKYCHVFCEDMNLLSRLHNKYIFQKIARENYMGAIETFITSNPSDPIPNLDENKTYVAKPVFSRFGDKALLNLHPHEIRDKLSPDLYPWAVQEYIRGEEFCSYAICRNGVIISQSCYQPYFRAGQGSSVYFKAVLKPEIFKQVEYLVKGLHYTGQIGFDFIESPDGKTFVLECNPRCTSGVHLSPHIDWESAFSIEGPGDDFQPPVANLRSKMISLAMIIYGLRPPNKQTITEFIHSYVNADDVIFTVKDWKPSFGQFLSLIELLWRRYKTGQSLKDASTTDIEWDGQDIE